MALQAINEEQEQFFHLPSAAAAAAALEEAGAAAFRGAVERRQRSQTIISLSAEKHRGAVLGALGRAAGVTAL